jgi:hypothetical protein
LPKAKDPNLNMAPPFKCPDCPAEFPNYQKRFHHRIKDHGFQPSSPGQYQKRVKGPGGDLRCREIVNGKKCGARYERPQDLGRHKWFAHGIRGIHAAKNGAHTNGGIIHVEHTIAAPTFTQDDLQFEGTAAFTAGEVYAKIQQRAEAAGLPYTTLAERVNEFVRATAGGPKLGRSHSVPFLPGKAAA